MLGLALRKGRTIDFCSSVSDKELQKSPDALIGQKWILHLTNVILFCEQWQ